MILDKARRKFVSFSLAGIALAASGALKVMPASARQTIGHEISLKNAHTGERYKGVYRIGSYYVPGAFRKINRLMRDHRTGGIIRYYPRSGFVHVDTGDVRSWSS